ncbi:MAG TPA: GrpB family protein [Caulobacteraceae bacterium]|jgi:GrpB-like predicted nucleotidyltransferase (UPF0157 family)
MPFPDESKLARVVDPQPEWAKDFAALAAALREALGHLATSIDHIGSTSVPGLEAKDCIDVQVRVGRLDDPALTAALAASGFRLRSEPWNRSEVSSGVACERLTFAPPLGARASNVHVRPASAPNARYALLFRDYLRADSSARAAWGAFKLRLAESVPDLFAYGQIKAPATEVLMLAAERWAAATGWSPTDA